jgi:hypothetical protein
MDLIFHYNEQSLASSAEGADTLFIRQNDCPPALIKVNRKAAFLQAA